MIDVATVDAVEIGKMQSTYTDEMLVYRSRPVLTSLIDSDNDNEDL